MERQTILERLGWYFIRIRGSEFYRSKEKTFERLTSELENYNIYPEDMVSENKNERSLLEKIKIRATQIREEWEAEYNAEQDEAITTNTTFSNIGNQNE